MHIAAKDRAASTFSGDCGRSTSVQRCWGCFTSLWWQVPFFFPSLLRAGCSGWRGGGCQQTQRADQEGQWWCGGGAGGVWQKLHSIMDNVSYHHHHTPLRNDLAKTRSLFGKRLIMPKCTSERHRTTFLTANIKLFNASLRQWKLYVTSGCAIFHVLVALIVVFILILIILSFILSLFYVQWWYYFHSGIKK